MDMVVPSSVLATDLGIYWVISMIFFWLMDLYASKKLGGKRMLGFKVLRLPKFFAMVFVSGYTIVLILISMRGFLEFTRSTMTYLGLPYFIAWVFFLVNVLRRIKAETKGRPWQ
jgi:hypothetical protein